MKRWLLFLLILVPLAALLTFSLTRDPRTLPSVLIGKAAPSFDLETLQGEKASLSSLKGHPIVLNFWSSWCGPCLQEHPYLKKARDVFEPRGIRFYSVLYEDTAENAKNYMTKYGEAATVLLDPGLKTAIDYGVSGVPETFFINAEGLVTYKVAGVLTPPVLQEQIRQLLAGGVQ